MATLTTLNICKWMEECRNEISPERECPVEDTMETLVKYFECPICSDTIKNPTQTQCGHVFCQDCLNSLIKNPPAHCPLCKSRVVHRGLNPRQDISDLTEMVKNLCEGFNAEMSTFFVEEEQEGQGQRGKKDGDQDQDQVAPKKNDNDNDIPIPNTKNKLKRFDSVTTLATTTVDIESGGDQTREVEFIDIADTSSVATSFSPGPPLPPPPPLPTPKTNKPVPAPSSDTVKQVGISNPIQTASNATTTVNQTRIPNVIQSNASNPKALQYMIFTMSSVPSSDGNNDALDLSKKKKKSQDEECTHVYASAFKFIKPLDLSLKKRKRDLEAVEPEPKSTSTSTTENLNKRGKFEVKSILPGGRIVEEKTISTGEDEGAPVVQNLGKRGRFEKMKSPVNNDKNDEDMTSKSKSTEMTGVGVPESQNLKRRGKSDPKAALTVTSDMNEEDKTSKSSEKETVPVPESQNLNKRLKSAKSLASSDKNEEDKMPIKTAVIPASAIQNLTKQRKSRKKSQMSRSSDQKGDNTPNTSNEVIEEVPVRDIAIASVKMTNSDELLSKIADDVDVEVTSLTSKKPAPPTTAEKSTSKPRGQMIKLQPKPPSKDDVFKLPTSSPSRSKAISRSSKKENVKDKDKENAMATAVASSVILNLDFDDDDFLNPRDSDALFMNVREPDYRSTSTSTPRKSQTEKEKASTSSGSTQKNKNVEDAIAPSPVPLAKKTSGSGAEDQLKALFGTESDDWMNGVSTGQPKEKTPVPLQLPPLDLDALITENNELNSDMAFAKNRQIVFCSSRLKKSQLTMLKKLSDIVGGSITKEMTPNFSHLIITLDNGRVPQTFKYLMAIAGHKWVVVFDWVLKCVEKGALIPETPYETSKENFDRCDSGVKRSRLSKTNLLEGFKFLFASQEPYNNLGYTFDEVGMLFHQLGAVLLMDETESMTEDKLIIIGCKNASNLTDYNYWLNSRKFITVTFEWVIDSVLDYRLQSLKREYLCVGEDLSSAELRELNIPDALKSL